MAPFGPFWSSSGPRSSDGFGILGSRSDENGNSRIIGLFFFCLNKRLEPSYTLMVSHFGASVDFV